VALTDHYLLAEPNGIARLHRNPLVADVVLAVRWMTIR
jgi:hypothetical protein